MNPNERLQPVASSALAYSNTLSALTASWSFTFLQTFLLSKLSFLPLFISFCFLSQAMFSVQCHFNTACLCDHVVRWTILLLASNQLESVACHISVHIVTGIYWLWILCMECHPVTAKALTSTIRVTNSMILHFRTSLAHECLMRISNHA